MYCFFTNNVLGDFKYDPVLRTLTYDGVPPRPGELVQFSAGVGPYLYDTIWRVVEVRHRVSCLRSDSTMVSLTAEVMLDLVHPEPKED